MGWVLYGDRCSGSATVELAFALAGVDVEVREVSLRDDAQRKEAYRAINPQRKLPTLISPEGDTLTESAAILLTLHDRLGGLLPDDPNQRAQAVRWLVFTAAELYPLVEINDYPSRFAPDAPDAVRERARALWRDRLLVIEAAVTGDPWLLPSGPCMVDGYIAVVTRWAQQHEWRPSHVPKIEALAAAVRDHETLGPVWRRHWG